MNTWSNHRMKREIHRRIFLPSMYVLNIFVDKLLQTNATFLNFTADSATYRMGINLHTHWENL